MSIPTKEQLKARSKHLTKLLEEKYGVKVGHGHCLDVIAQLFGHKDWNTAAAVSPNDELSKADGRSARNALAEALYQGFDLCVEQPYKKETYYGGGVTASHSTEQGTYLENQLGIRTDPQTRIVTIVLPRTTSVSTSNSVIDMHKQLYLEKEKVFADVLGGKAEDLTKANRDNRSN